jgi:uncharacterized protein YkuJ
MGKSSDRPKMREGTIDETIAGSVKISSQIPVLQKLTRIAEENGWEQQGAYFFEKDGYQIYAYWSDKVELEVRDHRTTEKVVLLGYEPSGVYTPDMVAVTIYMLENAENIAVEEKDLSV